jgi:hypothetical protein
VKFVCCDLPEANDLTIGVLAVVAQAEAQAISKRTRDALQVARKRIVEAGQRGHRRIKRLGNPNGAEALRRAGKGNRAAIAQVRVNADQRARDLATVVQDIRSGGAVTLEAICQSAFKFDPSSASNFDPFARRGLAVALGSSELAGIAETRRARVA